MAQAAGTGLWGAKAHGALYHAAAEDPRLAAVFLDGVTAAWPDVGVIVGPPKGHLADASRARGLTYAREGFADRGYTAEGALVQRGLEGALLTSSETCVAQALELAEGGQVETLCVHGDGARSGGCRARSLRGSHSRKSPREVMKVHPYGDGALFIDLEADEGHASSAERTRSLATNLRAQFPQSEIVTGAGSLAVIGAGAPLEEVARIAESLMAAAPSPAGDLHVPRRASTRLPLSTTGPISTRWRSRRISRSPS